MKVSFYGVKRMVRKVLKRAAALVLMGTLVTGASGISGIEAFATDKDVALGNAGASVHPKMEASFTITEDDLNSIGYDAVVTVPISFPLKFDKASKSYKGSADYYVSGKLDKGYEIYIMDGLTNDSHKVYKADSNEDVSAENSKSLIKYSIDKKAYWTVEECRTNMETRLSGGTDYITGQVSAVVPLSAIASPVAGKYYTVVAITAIIKDE